MQSLLQQGGNSASQLVAKYNGTHEADEVHISFLKFLSDYVCFDRTKLYWMDMSFLICSRFYMLLFSRTVCA
jgi:hypothetical protein